MQDVTTKSQISGQEEGKHKFKLLILSQNSIFQESLETKSQNTKFLYYLYQEE